MYDKITKEKKTKTTTTHNNKNKNKTKNNKNKPHIIKLSSVRHTCERASMANINNSKKKKTQTK